MMGMTAEEFDAFTVKVAEAFKEEENDDGDGGATGGSGGGGVFAVFMLVFANARMQMAAFATLAIIALTIYNA